MENHEKFVPNATSIGQTTKKEVLFYSKHLSVRPSQIHGIGVFADKDFVANETIEVFPIIPLSFRTNYQGDARVLDYSAIKFCECEECKKHGYVIFMRLGYGGLYNHQDNNNAKLYIDYNEYYGKCVAEKDIAIGSEIFINYGPNYIFREGKNSIRE
jgi:SET domain-containing protein